jgi:hypothetical protein
MQQARPQVAAAVLQPIAARWRSIAEEAGVVDLNAKPPTIEERCAHYAPAFRVHAVMTRDTGYASGKHRGFAGLVAAERALHLAIDYRAALPGPFLPHDHDMTSVLCAGAFGDWLPLVLCQRQDPTVGRMRDAWHFLVFTTPDWQTPICGLRPEGYMTWRQRQEWIDTQARAGA